MVACMLMALGGFLTFGDKTLGNVLNNFPADNIMVNVARLCFGLNMLTTLPLEAFVCREVMLNYYYPGAPFNLKLHLLSSTGLILGAMTLSLITCDLGVIFELVGATSACAMAYILPPLCYIKLTTRSWKTYVAAAIVVFGCAVMGISVIQAVGQVIRGEFFFFFTPSIHHDRGERKLTQNHNHRRRWWGAMRLEADGNQEIGAHDDCVLDNRHHRTLGDLDVSLFHYHGISV